MPDDDVPTPAPEPDTQAPPPAAPTIEPIITHGNDGPGENAVILREVLERKPENR